MKKIISRRRTNSHEVRRFVLTEDTKLDGRVYPRGSKIWRNGSISFVQLGRDLKINDIKYLANSLLWLYPDGHPRSGTIAEDLELDRHKVLPTESDIYLDPDGKIEQVNISHPVKYAGGRYPAGARLHLDIKAAEVLTTELPEGE
jgi:hypothetical protein